MAKVTIRRPSPSIYLMWLMTETHRLIIDARSEDQAETIDEFYAVYRQFGGRGSGRALSKEEEMCEEIRANMERGAQVMDYHSQEWFDSMQWMARAIAAMTAEVRAVNTANGWHDEGRTFGDGIALLHSEVSEALEAFREQGLRQTVRYTSEGGGYAVVTAGDVNDMNWRDKSIGKPEGVGSEFADVLIRLLDECDRQGIDLVAEYVRKINYNKTRQYKHGGKAL